jgi:hypothetical protein
MKLSSALPFVFAAACGACASTPKAQWSGAAAAFERLKQLDGAWVTLNGSAHSPESTDVHYQVTGAGSALVETIGPGTAHEMVSVYHLADGGLVMTHYCALGNQPYMVGRPGENADELLFECVGGAGVERGKGVYMARARFAFRDASRVDATWSAMRDGKLDHETRFELVRSWK